MENIGIIIIVAILDVVIASVFADNAKYKGYKWINYFLLSVFLTLPGWLMVCALPDRKMRKNLDVLYELVSKNNTNTNSSEIQAQEKTIIK